MTATFIIGKYNSKVFFSHLCCLCFDIFTFKDASDGTTGDGKLDLTEIQTGRYRRNKLIYYVIDDFVRVTNNYTLKMNFMYVYDHAFLK